MRLTRLHIVALLTVALAAAVLSSCSEDEKGGTAGTGKPVTLRIGTDDEPGKPASDQIKEFARRVQRISDGDLRIEPVWHAAGDGPDWDQRVARMITSGELDMGLIPSRSWDTEGVTSLRALNAPFLIESDELLGEVVSGELADDLMSGLGKAGVTGIALFPEGLRHPFGLKRPLRGPDDYEGVTIRTPTSKTTAAVFEALGATVNDEEPDPRVHAALESSYLLEPNGTATGNVSFYPKVNTLVIGKDAFEDLDEVQRETLAKAARQTRDWALAELPSDAEAAKSFCELGRELVLASEADLAALERATAPVTAELARDEQTGRLIAAIRELAANAGVSAAEPARCGAPAGSDGEIARLDGVYRFELTDENLRKAGVTDAADVAENHGVFTITMTSGEYCWEQRAPNPLDNPEECSTYELDGDRLVWQYPAGQPDVYRVRRGENGDLELTALDAAPGDMPYARAWAANTWKRIGDS